MQDADCSASPMIVKKNEFTAIHVLPGDPTSEDFVCDLDDEFLREVQDPLVSHVAVGHFCWDTAAMSSLVGVEKVWLILPRGTRNHLDSLPRDESADLLELWSRASGILTQDRADLSHVAAKMPQRAALVELVEDMDADALLSMLGWRMAATDSVVINTSLPFETTHMDNATAHFVADHLDQVKPASRVAHHWAPARKDRRDEAGFIEARNLAWHLNCAAATTNSPLVVVDRLDVLKMMLRSEHVQVTLGVILSSATIAAQVGQDAQRLSDLLTQLSDSKGWVFLLQENDAERLNELGFQGRVKVIDSYSDAAVDPFLEVARGLRPIVELSQEKTILLAGHDFKFAGELVQVLTSIPKVNLKYDAWERQLVQKVSQSDKCLRDADIIICEFASYNAVWYSWHKLPHQRLIVRFHGYELFQEWIKDINVRNVDSFVFVSAFYRDKVVRELGWPVERTMVVPNMVDPVDLDRRKAVDARFHLGIAGIVPVLKRPDRALDLLERLLEADDRFVLHVRGRNPWDYAWMWRDPVIRDAYEGFYERLRDNPELLAHVAFDEFGPDMGQWFRRIGWMLSPSSRETFHLAPVEGMAGGAVPVVWEREGAREIFSSEWVHESTQEAADYVLAACVSDLTYEAQAQAAREWSQRFTVEDVARTWVDVIFGAPQATPEIDSRFDRESMLASFEEKYHAAAFDRLLLVLLKRYEDLEAVEALVAEYPKHFLSASRETRQLIERMTVDRTFDQASFVRAPRCAGSAYLIRHHTSLTVFSSASLIEGTTPDDAVDVRMVGGAHPSGPFVYGSSGAHNVKRIFELPGTSSPTDAVQLVADAIVRQARVTRPSVLVTLSDWHTAWSTVLAGRRLGIPVILVENAEDKRRLPAREEFDGVVGTPADVTPSKIDSVWRRYRESVNVNESVLLEDLTVGLIADEFTTRTIAGRCRTISIPRQDAYLHVASNHLDVLFIESAWSGIKGDWFHGVAYYKDDREDIEQVVRVAKAKGVPVVFWNKEDPIHFKSFAPTAALCDVVYTTDAGRLPNYLENSPERGSQVVASMPFYAEPRLHNPLPGEWAPRPTVSYAGTYYGPRYADRSAELDKILTVASKLGLTIYDRQRNHPNSPYHFPESYDDFIEGGLSYDQVLEAYKAHPVHINVNSVNNSPTMFSRRVVEIAASGSVVVSGKGTGLQQCLPAVPVSEDAVALGHVMEECLTNTQAWRSRAWEQLREVTRSYLAEQALAIMFRGAGIAIRLRGETDWSARVETLDAQITDAILRQTLRPAEVVVPHRVPHELAEALATAGVRVSQEVTQAWSARWTGEEVPATWAEDLMHAARFAPAEVTRIGARRGEHELAQIEWDTPTSGPVFTRPGDGHTLVWLRASDALEPEPVRRVEVYERVSAALAGRDDSHPAPWQK